MIITLKIALIILFSYFAAFGMLNRYRVWKRKRGVRFIIEVIQDNNTIAINGIKESDKFFTSTEEEAILDYLQESNQIIVSRISSEEKVKRLTKKYLQARNKRLRKVVEDIVDQNKKGKS